MSRAGKLVAIIMMVNGATLLTTNAITINKRKKEEKRNAQISSIIDKTELEFELNNIKGITQIDAVKNNGEFLVIIEGELNHKVNGKSDWTATYKVDNIDYKEIRKLTNLQEKIIYVCDNIYSQYEPIDVSYSETELVLI